MDKKHIDGGYILISRHILENDIWYKSPAFLKIFLYILLKVNYKNGNFPKGSNYFNFQQEKIYGVSTTQVYEFLRWAKSEEQHILTTQKTTRGTVLKVNNYDYFQDQRNYKNQNKNQNRTKTEPKQNQNRTNTIKETRKKEELINLSLSKICNAKNITKRERNILISYLKKNKSVKSPYGLLKTIILNDDYKQILEDEKKRLETKDTHYEPPTAEITDEEREETNKFLIDFRKKLFEKNQKEG